MVWKASTTVVVGVKGKYLIAWLCKTKPNEDTKFKDNVAKKCIVDKVNQCFVKT